jgi:hypothetical protein
MMPSPERNARGGAPNGRTAPGDRAQLCHLMCPCQYALPHPLTLCGSPPIPRPEPHPHAPCAVCYDLGPTVVATGRCQRCPA